MDATLYSCREFVNVLASSQPAPGGGGAAALVGAIATALGNMVASLTLGKKTYAAQQEEILSLKAQCDRLQEELLDQVQADEECFLPLSKAYKIPKDDPQRESALEKATLDACAAPMKILSLCAQALSCIETLSQKGSRLALSDAGCAAVCCKAALQSAALNVWINTGALQNREEADRLDRQVQSLLDQALPLADAIFASVQEKVHP